MTEEPDKNPLRILIAEDNPVYLKLLEKTLVKAGYEVVMVRNGEQALDRFKKSFFPLVITDWMMPRMSGIELCEEIRRLPSSGYIYIIFLTAKDAKNDIISALDAGADDYLTKPFNHAELTARLQTGQRILALEKSLKEANEEIKKLSIRDPLTNCYNRRYAMQEIPKEVARAVRYRDHLSLIMFDIDYFKKVNDSYGHLAGDAVLKAVVACVMGGKGGIRENDWLARYGGEEFIVLLPKTPAEGAFKAAERLREKVATTPVRTEDEKIIEVTASFGIVSFDPSVDKGTSIQEMIKVADECLYQAKDEGRNTVRAKQKSPPIPKVSGSQ